MVDVEATSRLHVCVNSAVLIVQFGLDTLTRTVGVLFSGGTGYRFDLERHEENINLTNLINHIVLYLV